MVRWIVRGAVSLVAAGVLLPTQTAMTLAALIGFMTTRMLPWSVAVAAPASMERS